MNEQIDVFKVCLVATDKDGELWYLSVLPYHDHTLVYSHTSYVEATVGPIFTFDDEIDARWFMSDVRYLNENVSVYKNQKQHILTPIYLGLFEARGMPYTKDISASKHRCVELHPPTNKKAKDSARIVSFWDKILTYKYSRIKSRPLPIGTVFMQNLILCSECLEKR